MKFRNYCIVVMGNTKDVLAEIIKISEIKPNVLDAKGVLIATFSSIAEPKELTEYFKSCNRNFLIFDLNPENSGFHITKPDINEGLFGFLKEMNEDILNVKFNSLIEEISSTTVTTKVTQKDTVSSLEEQLQDAIDTEDFELAVKLRDKIAAMSKDKKTR